MGKLNDSLLSGSSGRTGKLVVANVGGVEILKVRPRKSSKGPSTKQLLVQTRMRRCFDFILAYKHFASLYFGTKIGLRSSYNQAMSNLINAFKLDYSNDVITPIYADVAFSRGPLAAAIPTGLSSPSANSIKIDWYNNVADNPDRETDKLQVLLAAEGDTQSTFLENVANRIDLTVTLEVPPFLQTKKVHVWISFLSQDASIMVSNSSYVGEVVIS